MGKWILELTRQAPAGVAVLTSALLAIGAAIGYVVRLYWRSKAAEHRAGAAQTSAERARASYALESYQSLVEDLRVRIDELEARVSHLEEELAKERQLRKDCQEELRALRRK